MRVTVRPSAAVFIRVNLWLLPVLFFILHPSSFILASDKGLGVEAIRAADRLGANRYALVIGINDYADAKIPDLKFAESDAQLLSGTLTDPQTGGFKPENVTLLLGKQASSREIKKALAGLRGVGADDLVVVYFSGHGAKQRGETCWVTQDAELNFLADTALTNDQIEKYLTAIPSKRLVVLIDACAAADTVINQKSLLDSDAIAKAFTGAGRVTIASAGSGEESIEAPDFRQGIFTHFLVGGLRGAADQPPYGNLDGVQTLSEVWSYLSDRVTQEARQRPGIQVPTKHALAETQTDKFLLTINAPRLVEVERQKVAANQQTRGRIETLTKLFVDQKLTAEQLDQASRLLQTPETDLDEPDRHRRRIYTDLADGGLKPDYLQAVLDSVETPDQRATRLEREARDRVERGKSARIADLLATAQANDNKENGSKALAALDELLKLNPSHTEAWRLRAKIRGYYPKVGKTMDNPLGMLLMYVPAGEFLMGSTAEERQWAAGPEGQGKAEWFTPEGQRPRRATIKDRFWMGRTEVTVGQWKKFVAATSYQTEAEKRGEAWAFDWDNRKWGVVKGANWRDPKYGFDVKDEHPVACVSWNDAVAFCDWLTGKEREAGRLPAGMVYRLPTEAEWEYACRGGREGTKFWWGDSVQDGKGRLNVASADARGQGKGQWTQKFPWSDGFAWVSPVDNYGDNGRNGFGLADMLGNVWEWCLDGWDDAGAHEEYYTGDTARRVLRGGSFHAGPGNCRCAPRGWYGPTLAYAFVGFRVVVGVAR